MMSLYFVFLPSFLPNLFALFSLLISLSHSSSLSSHISLPFSTPLFSLLSPTPHPSLSPLFPLLSSLSQTHPMAILSLSLLFLPLFSSASPSPFLPGQQLGAVCSIVISRRHSKGLTDPPDQGSHQHPKVQALIREDLVPPALLDDRSGHSTCFCRFYFVSWNGTVIGEGGRGDPFALFYFILFCGLAA